MTRLGRRVARVALSLWALATLSFLLIHLIPGDPVRASLGLTAPLELVEARRSALGLDRPIVEQYASYVANLARGDLGQSFMSQLPVTDIIAQRLSNTLLLSSLALACVLLAGVPIGLWTAIRLHAGGRAADGAFQIGSSLAVAMPEFITATLLAALFAVTLGWLPVAGQAGPSSYIMPVLALAMAPTAALARVVRIEASQLLAADYFRTARAKRLGWRRLYLNHLLPNCMTATLSVGGLIFAGLVAGTVLIENIFAWPGLGSAIALSIVQKDYPLTQGLVLTFGFIILAIHLGVDMLIAAIDPRSGLRHD